MGARRWKPRCGGFISCSGSGEQKGTKRALPSFITEHLHQLEFHHPLCCTLQARLYQLFSKGGCTHRQEKLGKAYLKLHSKCSDLCWGSSHGLANGNHVHKPSADFKEVVMTIKVMLSAVASIIPTLQQQNFYPKSLLCF